MLIIKTYYLGIFLVHNSVLIIVIMPYRGYPELIYPTELKVYTL